MKVLFITNVPAPYRVDFFNSLGESCELTVLFETRFAKNRDKDWTAGKFENFKAVFMRGIRVGDAEAFCPEVIGYLSLKNFDVIVVGFYASLTGMLAIEYMRLRHIPFLLNSDGGVKKAGRGFRYKIKKHFIGAASGWLSTGKITSEYLAYYGAGTENIYVYPFTSVKESEILPKPLTIKEKMLYRDKLGIREEKVILSVGQFIPRKGYDLLLKACKELDKKIGVYIVGGQATNEYLLLQKELYLTNVHFVGFKKRKELADYYRAADVFVLPTREDIWGLVINEAMSYGLPIITTDKCVAGNEMVKQGVNGYIVAADEKSIFHGMEEYFRDYPKVSMGYESLRTAEAYSVEKMAERHIQIFEQFREIIHV